MIVKAFAQLKHNLLRRTFAYSWCSRVCLCLYWVYIYIAKSPYNQQRIAVVHHRNDGIASWWVHQCIFAHFVFAPRRATPHTYARFKMHCRAFRRVRFVKCMAMEMHITHYTRDITICILGGCGGVAQIINLQNEEVHQQSANGLETPSRCKL